MKAVITLEAENNERAKSILRATIPDNLLAPNHLEIKSIAHRKKIIFKIKSEKLDTLVATIDDLLSCVQAVEKSIIAVDS